MVVKEGDSMTVLGTVLGVVALAATAVPAHRAASINPVSSLRGD
jgi:ABC-type lipoprotein release transport system permease subunit